MSEETMPREKAVEDVRIMAERMAFLHYAFAKTLSEMLSAVEADHLTRMAIEEYGRLAAASVTEHLEEQGKPVTLMNFRYGKDLPSVGWEYTPIAMPEDKPAGKISKITYCPLAATWKKLPDGCRLGRYYCWIDQMKYKHYGRGYHCFHDKNAMDGDECCIIRCELREPEEN